MKYQASTLSVLHVQARIKTLIMGGLLKSVARNPYPSEGRKIVQALLYPHENHVTVSQVSRDFSSVGTAGPDREDLVTFLVGETFAVPVAQLYT